MISERSVLACAVPGLYGFAVNAAQRKGADMRVSKFIVAILALALSGPALGKPGKLAVGDSAPELNIEAWVRGDEVQLAPGKVYVVEFWATWCVPCKKSIPHLTKLQERYGRDKLVIIGISDEDQETVEAFVRQQGKNMDYTVATDRRSGTTRTWMRAAGVEGLPHAFIVDRAGKVAFIGSPLDEAFDTTLAKVMTGRYDPVLQAQAEPVLQSARRARDVRNWRMALRFYDEVIALDPRVFAEVAIERFEMILIDMKDMDQAYQYASGDLIDVKFAKDAGALGMLAEKIAAGPELRAQERDLEVALEAAERSLALAGASDPESLSVAALVHFHRGELDQAIELQTRAYFLARPEAKAGYRRVLTSYRAAADRATAGS
jgi:thiol-disulfide isomerase/thioredoxin